MLLVALPKFVHPETFFAEELCVWRHAADKREPPDAIGLKNVIGGGVIHGGMSRCRRADGGEVRRTFLESSPLVEPGVGSAPHGYLAVAPGLLRQPLDDVVAVARVPGKGLERSPRVAPAANIYQGEDVAVAGEEHGPVVIGV